MTSDWWRELLSEEMAVDTPEVLQHSADPSSHGRKPQSAQVFDDAEQAALLAHQGCLSQQSQMSSAYQPYGYWYGRTQDQRNVMSGDVILTPSLFPPQYRPEEPLPTAHAAHPARAISQMRHVQAPPEGQTQTPPIRQTQSPEQTRAKKRRLQHNQRILHPSSQSRNNLRIRSDVIQRIKSEDALVKTEYDPATIARDVLINSGKHPTERFLNEHLEPLRKNFDFVDYHSDLSTFRWDIVDPVIPPAVPAAKGTQSHVITPLDRSLPPARTPATRPQVEETPSLVSPINPPLSHPHPHSPQFLPPHSTQPPPPASTPSQQAQAKPTPKPSPAKPSPTKPSPAKARLSPQLKDTSQLEAVRLSSVPSMPPKGKAGRAPPKKRAEDNATDDKAQDDKAPLINWPVFACRWTKCPAELHNLETLKRHIVKLHIPNNIKCGWEACTNPDGMPANELWNHVQESHISRVAWELGDGPRIYLPEEQDKHRAPDIETTLSTKTGGTDPIILPAHKNAVNAYLKIHNINDSYGRAEALLRGGIHWKDQVGPTIDKSGYTLSAPARQWKTDPNEGIMELVDDDDE